MLIMSKCLLILILWTESVLTSDSEITADVLQYYEDLIRTERQRGLTYELPKSAEYYRPKSREVTDSGTFDFIIIGGGSAGSVVASRLSEIKKWKVLLLEAGGLENDFSDIPNMHLYLQGTEFNWGFNTTPQTTCCLGMIDNSCHYPRGRVLGGTSSINGLVYVRGNRLDYDAWAELGNEGWSYEEVLPYFKKSEYARLSNADPGYHNHDGYLFVEEHHPSSPQTAAFLEANLERGRQIVDYNGREQLGVSEAQVNNQFGRRHSSARAFLQPAASRNNLKIWINSYVTKILIDPSTKEAYGVKFANKGRYYIARAKKEIILSAGAIQSPQILMLSGIGPARHLEDVGIPVVQDLPVGRYMQDHVTYFGLYFQSNYTELADSMENYIRQYLNGYGPYAIALNSQAVGFFQTSSAKIPGYPDIEFMLLPANSSSEMVQRAFHFRDEVVDEVWGRIDPQSTMCIYVVLLHPKSHGTITLRSSNPFEYPNIDPRYFSDPEGHDIETVYKGILLALDLTNTDAFRRLDLNLLYAPPPACKGYPYSSRAYWYCAIRQLSSNLYHPVGTCRMTPDAKKGGVVDPRLRVHGISSLRVADASIIPFPLSAHTHGPAVMIGEKVSDIIKEEHLS